MMTMNNTDYRINTNTRTIHRYPLTREGTTYLKGCFSNVIHLGEKNGELCVWLERSLTKTDYHTGKQIPRDESEGKTYKFYTIGTGWPYQPSEVGAHIGTVVMHNGFVWHVFMKEVENNGDD